MKNILLVIHSVAILFIVLINAILFAQAPDTLWTETFGGSDSDFGNSGQQTTDGGYIITGYTASFGTGSGDVWLIKTDISGDAVWTKTFGEIDKGGSGSSVQQTSDGGYIIIGSINRWGGTWLIKTDSNGDTLWTKTFEDSNCVWGNSIQQTSDGGYIITASVTEIPSFTPNDLWLIKTDSAGDTLWTKTFGENGISQGGNSVKQTTDGGYIIAGYYNDDVWLIKTDAVGDTLWTKTFGRIDYDSGNCVQQTSDGGYIITGNTRSIVTGQNDVWLIKTDAVGDTLWTKIFGGGNLDEGNSVQQTSDGGYVIIGTTRSFGAGNDDFWLIKTNSVGDTLWTKTFGGSNYDWGNSIQQTDDSGYIITGTTEYRGAPASGDVWLIKVAPDITSAEEKSQSLINEYQLHQNFPNPFNPSTTIEYDLPKANHIRLVIYDLLGRQIRTLIDTQQQAGYFQTTWNGTDEFNLPVVAGVYLCRMEAGEFIKVTKLLLIK
jgi:hypothetical protein